MNPGDIGIPGTTGTVAPAPTLSPTATGSDITIGLISFGAPLFPVSDGLIFLTNQFRPNPNLPPGTIHITNDPAQPFFNNGMFPGSGGDVIFDSRGGIIAARAIAVENLFGGDGGDVTLLARDNIFLSANTRNTSISSRGQVGGNILLQSDRDIFIRGLVISQSWSQNNTPRTGGDITIRARNLSLLDRGVIGGFTTGTANTGTIDIVVSQSLTADGESSPGNPNGIYHVTAAGTTGNAGDIRIAANTISLINGTEIGSFAFGQGNTGNIEVVATESFSADGEGSLLTLGSGVYNSTVDGNAGRIDIRTPSLNLTNGGVIKSEPTGQGNSSNINITTTENFTADGAGSLGLGSGIYSSTVNGNGGEIGVQTRFLNLTNGGAINSASSGQGSSSNINITTTENFTADGVSRRGLIAGLPSGVFSTATNGPGGSLNVRAGSLNLTNGAALRTVTDGAGNAGEIDIAVSQTLNADGESRQGVIQGVSSTISSFAQPGVTGSTGKIRVGLKFRPALTPLSDITASSEIGVDGTVNIEILGIDPSRGLNTLPDAPQPSQLDSTCLAAREGKNNLIVTGRGGQPPTPEEIVNSAVWDDLCPPSGSEAGSVAASTDPTPERIVEAQGWVVGPNGKIVLTAEPFGANLASIESNETCSYPRL